MSQREVENNEEIKIYLPPSTPEDNLEEDDEDTTTPDDKGTDTPSDSSQENNESSEGEEASEALEPDQPSVPEATGPKPVEGETRKEYALRKELERVRREKRELMGKKLFEGAEVPSTKIDQPTHTASAEILAKYDETQVEQFKELMSTVGRELGYVKADELRQQTYQEQASAILDNFISNHPEYSADNDKDDVLWSRFQEEVKLYRPPTDPKEWQKIFNRVHSNIFGIGSAEDLTKVQSKQNKIRAASHSATPPNAKSSGVATQAKDTSLPSDTRQFLKGFSEEDLKDLGI